MTCPRSSLLLLLLAALFLLPAALPGSAESITDAERLFTLKIKPLLSQKCTVCHGIDPKTGKEKFKGDLDMRTREAILEGGESVDDLLVPGDSAKSFLMTVVRWEDEDYEMPPKENDRLTADQIALLEQWIDEGAVWPGDERQAVIMEDEKKRTVTEDGVIVATSGGLGDEWTYRRYKLEDIWAFRPLAKPGLPKGAEGGHPVDSFIGSKLGAAGFQPAPVADYRTLIRRASYDLTGLPPTPWEVDRFRVAWGKDPGQAWSDLVDRLLASRHYGERWAQHWLDVARYADTGGYSNDYERSNAWRYRDYVIRALNEDKPYDEFVREQVAGDELADRSLRRRISGWNEFQEAREQGRYNAEESEMLVASSFLRMGPWDPAMVKAPEARQLYLDDVVNAVGQTFLSTTMRCFKCHDHKFDPLPTRDYYRLYAAFAGTQLAERPAPFLAEENKAGFEAGRAMTRRLHEFADRERLKLVRKREAAARKWYEENKRDYVSHEDRKNLPDEEKPPRHVGLTPEEQGRLKVREQDEWIWSRRLERYEPMVQSVYNGPDPKFLNARKLRMNVRANNKWRPESHILGGGSLQAPGEPVTPGVLSALGLPIAGAGAEADPYGITEDLEGRRLAVADWIADPRNPLTARSIVNRVWQHHFGKPLAGNPNNFGVKGAKPTHPELLDWLAVDFVENGWKLKRLHRLIMRSETYRQSGRHPELEKLRVEDPTNDLFAYFPSRRLSAEELRDAMLLVSGELNTAAGGLPVMPEMNMEVALQPRMIQFSLAPAYTPSRTPEERNRRSIYAYRVRGLANPFLETFNQPNPNDSCEDRDSASVSPQAFTLMNSDVVTARSIAFALRVEEEAKTPQDQVRRAVRLAYGRLPTTAEREKLTAYLGEMRAYHAAVTPGRRTYPASITRSLVEEFTGETFDYKEILPVFEDYIPDKQAADVSPETRALADLCLLLFNSHEFVYLY